MLKVAEPLRLPLEEIEAFVAVAQSGSYTAAADFLGVSHSSLSRKVQNLEALLGVKLLERRSRGVELSIAGTQHYLKFRDALGLLGSAVRDTTADGQEVVRLSLLQSFATAFLFPAMPRISAVLGNIEMRYVFDRRPTDFRDGIDLAIRFGDGGWGDVRTVPLWESTLRPIAGAEIAGKIGPDARVEDILAYPLIHMGSPFSWTQWLASRGIEYDLRPKDHVFEEIATILSATEHGLGIALGRTETRHFVDEQRLCYVSSHILGVARRYFLVREEGRFPRAAVATFARAMLAAAGKEEHEINAFLS